MAAIARVCLMICGVCVLCMMLLGFALPIASSNGLDITPLADQMQTLLAIAAVLLVVGIGLLPLGGTR